MRTASENHCPHPTCPNQKPYGHFACKSHWFSLPVAIRNRISQTWREKKMADWLKAHDEAVAFWNEKIGAKLNPAQADLFGDPK